MLDRRSILTGLGTGLATMAIGTRADARDTRPREIIAVLGTGHLGGAVGRTLAKLGYTIVFGSRTPGSDAVKALVKACGPRAAAAQPAAAVARAGIVVFGLPWDPVKDLIPSLGDLGGKLVIDPMNTKLKLVEGYPARPDSPTSISEQLQAWLPGAKVVKAFNTILDKHLENPAQAGGPLSIPLAGADAKAKERVAQLVTEMGLDPVDTGPLIAARYIEDLLRFEVGYVIHSKGKMFEIYLRPVPH